MRLFTTHTQPGQSPVLVREGFSGAAFWFGAFWLAAHRAWTAAALTLAAALLTFAFARLIGSAIPLVGFATLQGLICPDLLRWSLAQRGFVEGPVVAAPDQDLALRRLLDV